MPSNGWEVGMHVITHRGAQPKEEHSYRNTSYTMPQVLHTKTEFTDRKANAVIKVKQEMLQ